MLSLALFILYSIWIDPSKAGLARSVGLSLREGWQHFGMALLAGCDFRRCKGDGIGFGLQGVDLSDCQDCLLFCPDAEPDTDLDAAGCGIGMRSPFPAIELHTRLQFGFLNAALAILGLIATQLKLQFNLSGRYRVILTPT